MTFKEDAVFDLVEGCFHEEFGVAVVAFAQFCFVEESAVAADFEEVYFEEVAFESRFLDVVRGAEAALVLHLEVFASDVPFVVLFSLEGFGAEFAFENLYVGVEVQFAGVAVELRAGFEGGMAVFTGEGL